MGDTSKRFLEWFGLYPTVDAKDADDFDDRDARDERDDRDARDDRGYGRPRSYGYDGPYADRYADDPYPPRLAAAPEPAPRAPEHVRFEPRSEYLSRYSEAKLIGERFRDGDVVTMDLEHLEPEERKRYLDFVSGMCFALRGRIDRDGTSFTILPEGVELSDSDRDALSG